MKWANKIEADNNVGDIIALWGSSKTAVLKRNEVRHKGEGVAANGQGWRTFTALD